MSRRGASLQSGEAPIPLGGAKKPQIAGLSFCRRGRQVPLKRMLSSARSSFGTTALNRLPGLT